MNLRNTLGLLEAHNYQAVSEVLRERSQPQPLADEARLTMVCMDTRPGDPACAYLADDQSLNLARHPGGLSGGARRVSGAWAVDDPAEYLEYSGTAHMNGLLLVKHLGEQGVDAVIHFGCKDNEVAPEAAMLVANKDSDVFEIAKDMTGGKLSKQKFARIAGGQALMLDAGHIAPPDVIINDYKEWDIPIAKLHGHELRGISLVDNHTRHSIKPMPKRHKPDHDSRAIYVTDTGLVVPKLAIAARAGLSRRIRPSTLAALDTIHKATLVKLLDIPYVTVEAQPTPS